MSDERFEMIINLLLVVVVIAAGTALIIFDKAEWIGLLILVLFFVL